MFAIVNIQCIKVILCTYLVMTIIMSVAIFRCDCPTGFSGQRCEENVNDCDMNLCENNATCVDKVGDYECRYCPWMFYLQIADFLKLIFIVFRYKFTESIITLPHCSFIRQKIKIITTNEKCNRPFDYFTAIFFFIDSNSKRILYFLCFKARIYKSIMFAI